jgi:hypothetical protein
MGVVKAEDSGCVHYPPLAVFSFSFSILSRTHVPPFRSRFSYPLILFLGTRFLTNPQTLPSFCPGPSPVFRHSSRPPSLFLPALSTPPPGRTCSVPTCRCFKIGTSTFSKAEAAAHHITSASLLITFSSHILITSPATCSPVLQTIS